MVLTHGSDIFVYVCVTVHSQSPYSNKPQNQRRTKMMTLSQHGRKGKSERSYWKPGRLKMWQDLLNRMLLSVVTAVHLHLVWSVWSMVHNKQ